MHYWIIAFLCAHQARSLLGQNAQPPTSAWELEVESERFSNFDLKLSQLVAGREASNVALSPISVKLVLAMLYEGARGNTSIELQRVLGIKQGGRSIDSERLRVILQSLQASHEGYEIAVGTKLFVDKDTYPYPRFEKDIKDKYNGTIEKINFKNTNEAVKKINSWAKTVTNGHIKHLLNEIDTSANTALLLVNALYFKGLWENQFPLNQTKDGTFYVDGVTPKNVSFMNAIHNLKFALSGELNASVIRLPYKGGKFAMYILLPLNRTGLPSLIQSLTAQKMRATVEEMQNYPVQIKLPKFNFEFSASLAPVLEELGLKEMFSPNANLSGIAESPKELVVTNVIQKAALEINEHGSTAAVATAVNLETRFGEHNAEFEATHPFLLYIEDETTKTVVFVAKVVNPNNQEESVVSATSVPPPTAAPTTRTPAPLAASPTLGVPGENAIHLKTSSSWSEGSEEEDYDDRRSQNAPVTSQEMLDALEVLKQGVKQCQVTPPRNACHDEMVSETSSKNHADGNQPFDKNMFSFFDIELMNALENSTNQENLVVSSASIKSALSLVYEASVGATREELASALRLDEDAVRAKRQLRAYQQALRMPSASTEVHSACRILVKKEGQRVKHDFIQLLSQYGSDLYSADYSDPAGVAKDVNDWVSGVTKGKIPKLVSKESISDQTSLLIVNAIYFNGLWRTPFEKPTIQGCFYTKASGCKMTEMMKVKGIFRRTIHKELNAHILELPYEDSRYSMVILLPNEQQGLQQVSRNLGHVPLFPVIEKMAYSEVAVFLPKFTIEYTVPLLDPLKNLNLRTMFTPQVDLSGMFKEFKVNGTQITNVVHKAKIEVTEEGTIAAGGTAVYAEALSSSSAVPFKVDHPFLFFIIDSQAGFLFQGKFADPSSPLTAKRQVNNNYGQSERIQTNEQGHKRVVELKRPQPNRPTYLYETSEE